MLLLLVSGSGVGLEDIDSFLAVAKKHGVTLGDADGASSVRRRSAVPPFFLNSISPRFAPSYNDAVGLTKTNW